MNKLDQVAQTAKGWVQAVRCNDQVSRQVILRETADYAVVEMAYFCQQAVSHCEDAGEASLCLTVFTNRLIEFVGYNL